MSCAPLSDFTQSEWYQRLSSPYLQTLLTSNLPPPLEDMTSLRRDRKYAIDELFDIDTKIQQPKTLPHAAEEHYKKLKKVVDDYSCLLSPVRRIPYEIVQEIFLAGTIDPKSREVATSYSSWTLRNGPWSHSQVCGLWRAAALGTPILWANISIVYDEISGDHSCHEQVRNLVDEGVRRACVYGPNLQVTISRLGSEICSDGGDVVISVARDVLRHSDKIVKLELDMERQRHIFPFLSVTAGGRPVGPWRTFHSLETLSIEVYIDWEGPRDGRHALPELLKIFSASPHLREINLYGLWVYGLDSGDDSDSSGTLFPWDQLNTFRVITSKGFDEVSNKGALAMVARSPFLEVFHISNARAFGSGTQAMVRHTYLTDLQIYSTDILQYLNLPVLQHLDVYFKVLSVDSAVVVTNFLRRSRCMLQMLDIFIDGFFDVIFAAITSLR
jgi:hypothetical protein